MAQLPTRPDEHAEDPRPALAAPAHARTRPIHWLGTAAALAAVVGTALAVAPAGAAVPTPDGPHTVAAASTPDAARATLPLDCAGLPTKIDQSFSADLSGYGELATVVSARCDSPTGTPPDGVFVLRAGPGGRPLVSAVLVRPSEGLTVRSMGLGTDGTIHARIDGYSSPDVPRCCADLHESFTWTPSGTGWTRTTSALSSQV